MVECSERVRNDSEKGAIKKWKQQRKIVPNMQMTVDKVGLRRKEGGRSSRKVQTVVVFLADFGCDALTSDSQGRRPGSMQPSAWASARGSEDAATVIGPTDQPPDQFSLHSPRAISLVPLTHNGPAHEHYRNGQPSIS